MITGAIFDVDGTLLDSMPMWDHAGEIYLDSMGIKAEENLEEVLFIMTMQEGADYLRDNYNLSLSSDEIMEGLNNTIADFYKYKAQFKPGVLEFLNNLKSMGVPMTIATSTDRRHIEAAMSRLGVLDYFVKINSTAEFGIGKEKPDVFYDCVKCMDSKVESTWVFEDAYHAAKTAHDAEFKVLGIFDPSSKSHHEELREYSDICIDSFKDIDMKFILS